MKRKATVLLCVLLLVVAFTSTAMAQSEEEFIQQLTREGMTASQMLEKANEKMSMFDTYKYHGTMNINTKVLVPIEEQQDINMVIDQEGVYQKPQKAYTKSITTMVNVGEEGLPTPPEQVSEALVEDGTMYIRTGETNQWMKLDLNPMMQEMESLFGKKDPANVGMTKEQIEMFGMYASYDEDMQIEGKNYYVINVDVDKDAFKKIYQQTMKHMFKYFEEMGKQQNTDNDEAIPKFNSEEVQNQMEEMIEKMEMEVNYKFYIDKETKVYDVMEMTQTVNMSVEEVKTQSNTQGKYQYYDFNKDVDFPVINPEDIMEMPSIQ
ncbi:hypothetical protein QBE52_07845 [Clostridiaceae bacterium 35-E11]